MTIWQPEPGETLLARRSVSFATGEATAVSGMRWFRDTERRDIQNELQDWPEGPHFAVRSKGDARLRKAGKFGAGALLVGVLGVLESLAGSGSTGNVARLGDPEEPENEVEDFPVMWAAPGTLARTLPWQLDPGRRPDTDRTHMVVTDKRVLVLGLLDNEEDPQDEVLWETKRSTIAAARRMKFSRNKTHFKMVFTDGSWCRLEGQNQNCRNDITRALEDPLLLVDSDDLTQGQQETVRKLLQTVEPGGNLLISRRPSGNFYVTYHHSDRVAPFHGIGNEIFHLMGPNGEPMKPQEGDI
ncbi:hypothetical protein OK074_7849 [Actinobacteria bacterium OK074]|nr:hypothetical protein OK074_7849 [Actinobacteria bacterium OK074]